MLVLTRKQGQGIDLCKGRIVIKILEIRPGRVRIGIKAPPDCTILRDELIDEEDESCPLPCYSQSR
jgi:carbon storage regulator CsrA